jgi:hypothetical protein
MKTAEGRGLCDAELWERELLAAGWTKKSATVWQSPTGALFRGPYGAWRMMKSLEAEEQRRYDER